MIRTKQLEELKRLHKSLCELGAGKIPSLEHHVMLALVSGEMPKLKPAGVISDTARKRIVGDRYSRTLQFGDVFASCNGYKIEMKQFKAHEYIRKKALGRFERDAQRIMVKAMDSESDASEIVDQLHEAAEKAGLKSLVAPAFENSED